MSDDLGGTTPIPGRQQTRLPRLEERVLAFWEADGTFEASVARAEQGADNEYVFYDGPPFANGLPTTAILLTVFVEGRPCPATRPCGHRWSAIRLGTATACRPRWRPEKELEFSGRRHHRLTGATGFNGLLAALRPAAPPTPGSATSPARPAGDFTNTTRPMDLSYMESVMWAFKRRWEKELLYQGEKGPPLVLGM